MVSADFIGEFFSLLSGLSFAIPPARHILSLRKILKLEKINSGKTTKMGGLVAEASKSIRSWLESFDAIDAYFFVFGIAFMIAASISKLIVLCGRPLGC